MKRGNYLVTLVALVWMAVSVPYANAYNVGDLKSYLERLEQQERNVAEKRAASDCPPWKPFPCPEGECIPLNYVCDKNDDCPTSGYDEDERMCTAKRRPPVDYTMDFLENLLQSNGPDYFVKFFGQKGANKLSALGGTKNVAIAFTESPTIKEFADMLKLPSDATAQLQKVLKAIHENKVDSLTDVQFKSSEVTAFKMYADKLVETGFLKSQK